MGWFYGFKLHLINHPGDSLAVNIAPTNTDDRKPLPNMCQSVPGKGYVGQTLAENLFDQDIELITNVQQYESQSLSLMGQSRAFASFYYRDD